jgi:hypothetical protein
VGGNIGFDSGNRRGRSSPRPARIKVSFGLLFSQSFPTIPHGHLSPLLLDFDTDAVIDFIVPLARLNP